MHDFTVFFLSILAKELFHVLEVFFSVFITPCKFIQVLIKNVFFCKFVLFWFWVPQNGQISEILLLGFFIIPRFIKSFIGLNLAQSFPVPIFFARWKLCPMPKKLSQKWHLCLVTFKTFTICVSNQYTYFVALKCQMLL